MIVSCNLLHPRWACRNPIGDVHDGVKYLIKVRVPIVLLLVTILKDHFWGTLRRPYKLWTMMWRSLLPLQWCVDIDEHMSCVAVQNLVYGCRNIPLSTVNQHRSTINTSYPTDAAILRFDETAFRRPAICTFSSGFNWIKCTRLSGTKPAFIGAFILLKLIVAWVTISSLFKDCEVVGVLLSHKTTEYLLFLRMHILCPGWNRHRPSGFCNFISVSVFRLLSFDF